MSQKHVRKLQKVSSHSYSINIPKALIDRFGWRERQKLVLTFGGRKHEITIKDWKPKRPRKRP